jgi:hypothetical protein
MQVPQEQHRSLLLLKLGSRLWSEVEQWPKEERPKELEQDTFFEYVLPYVKALSWLRHLSSPTGEDARRDITDRAFYKEGNDNPQSEAMSAVNTALVPRVEELIKALDLENLSAKELIKPSQTGGGWSLDEKAAQFLESQGLKEGARWVRRESKERWNGFQGGITLQTKRSHVIACGALWWLWESQELLEAQQPPIALVHMLARGLVKQQQKGVDLIGWNQANRLVSLQQARMKKEFTLGYCAREFVLCGLPYKPIKETKFVRQNGNFRLTILGDPTLGVPYGQDRLLIIWLATAFQASGKPDHNRIYFRSASDILKGLGLPIDGHERQLLKERLERVFHATYIAEYKEQQEDGSFLWVARRFQLIRAVRLWYQRPKNENQHTLEEQWSNFIELDAHFANELRERSLPTNMNTMIALKRSPALLDFYAWQAWRSYRLSQSKEKEARVPIFGPSGLWAQLGSVCTDERYGKRQIRHWQKELLRYWPDCPNELTPNAEWLLVRAGTATPMDSKLSLPGVRRKAPQFHKKPLLLDDSDEPSPPTEGADIEWERPPGEDPFPEPDDDKLADPE